jgi:hypothetical protein
MSSDDSLGARFAEALAVKDFDGLRGLLHPQVDFRAMTPRREWIAGDPDTVVSDVLRQWFEDSDEIVELLDLQTDSFADRQRVGYRFRGINPEGPFVVEQQAYLAEEDGLITWMRVLCSGFRPLS